MAPERYQQLVSSDPQVADTIRQMEERGEPRDPGFTPAGVDADLMFADEDFTVGGQTEGHPTLEAPEIPTAKPGWVPYFQGAVVLGLFFVVLRIILAR